MMNKDKNEIKYTLINNIKNEWYILLLILAVFAFGLYVSPDLPDRIPSHWNVKGEVDGWSSRAFGVWFLPLLNLSLYPLMILLPLIDPKKRNYILFNRAYRVIRIILHLFFALIYLATLLYSLGYHINIGLMVKFSVGLIFAGLGNYMAKIKHNYFVGIKTPWTLASEEVWKKTHRFAAPLWVSAGILGMILSFINTVWASYMFFVIILAIIFIPMVYSYLIFHRL